MVSHQDAVQEVAELLGRPPQGAFEVVVRHLDESPVVISNAPFLDDGTPMPTRWWLLGEPERTWVGRLEAAGGVARAERAVDSGALDAAHSRYAAARDALIDPDRRGPRPSGGVGGTRRGVKCLHAHYAWWLAGGDDPVGAWVAAQLAEQGCVARVDGLRRAASSASDEPDVKPVAAIDCGTNSTRLLIATRHANGSLVSVARRMHITRLGQQVDATGRLDPAAIERTLAVLRGYRDEMDDYGVGPVRATATSAARDADNREEFFGPAAKVVGIGMELLSGTDEASLSFAGATAELRARPGTYLVVDIGGGSTEFAYGSISADGTARVLGAESVNLGCVRISERFLTADPPSADQLLAARRHCDAVVAQVVDRVVARRPVDTLVGLAGTVSTLAAVDQGLDDYARDLIHHHALRSDRVEVLSRRLSAMASEERGAVPGMEPGRVEVIVGGLVVLESVLAITAHDEILVSEADILDGLAASLMR